MRCSRVLRSLSAYLDKELPDWRVSLVEAHLAACSRCKSELDSLMRLSSILGKDKPIEPSAAFEARFWQNVAREPARRLSPLWLPWLLPVGARVAIAVLAGVLLGAGTARVFPVKSQSSLVAESLDLQRFSTLQPDSLSMTFASLLAKGE